MTKSLFVAFLFCCLGLGWAEGLEDYGAAIGVEEGKALSTNILLVKREALPVAGKKNGGNKGKENRRKKTGNTKSKKKAKVTGRKKNKSKTGNTKSKKKTKVTGRKRNKSKAGNTKSKKKTKVTGRKRNKSKTGNTKSKKKTKATGRKRNQSKAGNTKSKRRTKVTGRKRNKSKTDNTKSKKKTKVTGRKRNKSKTGNTKSKKKTKVTVRKRNKTKKGRKPKEGINRKSNQPRQSTNYTSCVAKFIEYSRINELKARSIEQQVNRINNFKGIQDKKKGKKGDFKGTYDTLLSALGGNESAPECNGKPLNGTSRNAKYKGTLATLKECQTKIEKVCNYELNTTFNSSLQGCLTAAKQFKTEFKVCFDAKKSSAEACSCVDSIDTANYETLKACNTKSASDDVKAKKKACVKGFSSCKTAQDESVDGVGSCKKVNRCGGAPNKTEAARILTILNPLKEALANTKFSAALTKLGLNTGAGSDGKLPTKNGTRLSKLRMVRLAEGRSNNTDGQGCKDIEAEWKNFNTSGDKAVPGVDGDVDPSETKNTISSLDKLNNRASLETDLGSCAQEDTRQLTVTLTIVRIRFYVFWCGWFQVTVVEIKIIIITISFGLPPLPSPSPAPAPTPVATSAPGGGRHIVKQIMKRAAFSKE